jgi:hypothetical protein
MPTQTAAQATLRNSASSLAAPPTGMHSPAASSTTTPSTAAQAAPTRNALISPLADALMIGGASIATFLLYWLFVEKSGSILAVSTTAAALAFVVNSPHFMASYQLMYGDYRHMITQKKSFFWAAVISPILLITALALAFSFRSHAMLSFLIQGMYLSVGWHYVKQTFGTAIVTSAAQKRFFGKWERSAILLNLYAVWAMSWISSNIEGLKGDMYGVGYFALHLPAQALTWSYWITGLTLLVAVITVIRNWIETGVWPSLAALVSFASIYVWFLPVLAHPGFFYLIPFFHSLQYMLFVGALKWNQSRSVASTAANPRASRAAFIRNFVGFFGLAVVLGVLVFTTIPEWLDSNMTLQDLAIGPTMWMFAFSWFINVHHYFIDNVIWRGDNEFVREHLVIASMKHA